MRLLRPLLACAALTACGRGPHEETSARPANAATSAEQRADVTPSVEPPPSAAPASSHPAIHVAAFRPLERLPDGFPVDLMSGSEVSRIERADEQTGFLVVVHSRVAAPFEEIVRWYREHTPSVSSADTDALSVLHGLTKRGFYTVTISREQLPMRDGASGHDVRIEWSDAASPG